jgi:hypothetical protein
MLASLSKTPHWRGAEVIRRARDNCHTDPALATILDLRWASRPCANGPLLMYTITGTPPAPPCASSARVGLGSGPKDSAPTLTTLQGCTNVLLQFTKMAVLYHKSCFLRVWVRVDPLRAGSGSGSDTPRILAGWANEGSDPTLPDPKPTLSSASACTAATPNTLGTGTTAAAGGDEVGGQGSSSAVLSAHESRHELTGSVDV